jgi:hypothetical protein
MSGVVEKGISVVPSASPDIGSELIAVDGIDDGKFAGGGELDEGKKEGLGQSLSIYSIACGVVDSGTKCRAKWSTSPGLAKKIFKADGQVGVD